MFITQYPLKAISEKQISQFLNWSAVKGKKQEQHDASWVRSPYNAPALFHNVMILDILKIKNLKTTYRDRKKANKQNIRYYLIDSNGQDNIQLPL